MQIFSPAPDCHPVGMAGERSTPAGPSGEGSGEVGMRHVAHRAYQGRGVEPEESARKRVLNHLLLWISLAAGCTILAQIVWTLWTMP